MGAEFALLHYNSHGTWGRRSGPTRAQQRQLEVIAGDIRDPFMVRSRCRLRCRLPSCGADSDTVLLYSPTQLCRDECNRYAKFARAWVLRGRKVIHLDFGNLRYSPVCLSVRLLSPAGTIAIATKIAADKLRELSVRLGYQSPPLGPSIPSARANLQGRLSRPSSARSGGSQNSRAQLTLAGT